MRSALCALRPLRTLFPFPLAKNNADGNLVQTGFLPDPVDQIALIGKMNGLRVVAETNDRGRPARHLGGVKYFYAPTAVQRRRIFLDRRFDDPVQAAGADAPAILIIHLIHEFEQFYNPLAGQR